MCYIQTEYVSHMFAHSQGVQLVARGLWSHELWMASFPDVQGELYKQIAPGTSDDQLGSVYDSRSQAALGASHPRMTHQFDTKAVRGRRVHNPTQIYQFDYLLS